MIFEDFQRMSKYIKNHITPNKTTKTYLPVATGKIKNQYGFTEKDCVQRNDMEDPSPCAWKLLLPFLAHGKSRKCGKFLSDPLKKNLAAPPIPVWLLRTSNALEGTSYAKGVTPSLDAIIHFQDEPTLDFSVSLNKWIVLAGNTQLKCSGKRLILDRYSSVGACVPYL